MYNEYKEKIKSDPRYHEFLTTKDLRVKQDLVPGLLKDFFEGVGIDYETGLSTKGHEEGALLSKLYAQLIREHPEVFPDLIYVSPYVRTRTTAKYLLEGVEGLDIPFDHLLNQTTGEDLIL